MQAEPPKPRGILKTSHAVAARRLEALASSLAASKRELVISVVLVLADDGAATSGLLGALAGEHAADAPFGAVSWPTEASPGRTRLVPCRHCAVTGAEVGCVGRSWAAGTAASATTASSVSSHATPRAFVSPAAMMAWHAGAAGQPGTINSVAVPVGASKPSSLSSLQQRGGGAGDGAVDETGSSRGSRRGKDSRRSSIVEESPLPTFTTGSSLAVVSAVRLAAVYQSEQGSSGDSAPDGGSALALPRCYPPSHAPPHSTSFLVASTPDGAPVFLRVWQVGAGWLLHGPSTHAKVLLEAADAVLLACDFGATVATLPTARSEEGGGGPAASPRVHGAEAAAWARDDADTAKATAVPSGVFAVAPEDRADTDGLAVLEAFLGWWAERLPPGTQSSSSAASAPTTTTPSAPVLNSKSRPLPPVHLVTTGLAGDAAAVLVTSAASAASMEGGGVAHAGGWTPPALPLGYGGLWSTDVASFVASTALCRWFPVSYDAPGAGLSLQHLLGTLVDDYLFATGGVAGSNH